MTGGYSYKRYEINRYLEHCEVHYIGQAGRMQRRAATISSTRAEF